MKFLCVPSLCQSALSFRFLLLLLAIAIAPKTFAQQVIFSDGFENGLNGWLVGDNNIEPPGTPCYWGVVDSAFGGESTHGGTNKAYCAAVGYVGSFTSPNYQSNMAAYLTRTIDLTGYTNATLSFWHKLPTIETPVGGVVFDYVMVLMDNAVLYSNTAPYAAWTQVTASLERFIGGPHTLQFLFISDDSVVREGWYLDDILVTDSYTPGPPPANNNFAAAQVLLGAVGSVSGNNSSTTLETGEPTSGFNATNSVWYRWSAVTNGPVTFRTGGSGFDTLLCIWTGNTVSSLTPVACDDNGDTNGASLISFSAIQGTIYRIQVRGANNARGPIQLSWSQPGGIGVDKLPDISLWTDETLGYLHGWYIDRSEPLKPGRTLLRAATATINIGTGPLELVGSTQTNTVYQRIYSTDGGYREHLAGHFTFHPYHGHLHFDNWLNFHLREILPGNGVGNIVVSGDKTSFAIIDLEAYNLNLPGAPSGIQYQGGLVQGISVGWGDVYDGSLVDQWIDITGVAPGRYWLEAIVDPDNHVIEQNESNNVARILIDLSGINLTSVANDYFTNAMVLPGITAGVIGYNAGATRETSEPIHHQQLNEGGASVWYRWTAPSNMNATITTEGSGFDTFMAVYTGSQINGLSPIAQNDDADAEHRHSRVTFTAFANTTYRIVVDGFNGAEGPLNLNLNPAWNNDFTRPVQISGFSGTTSGSTRGATRQSGEPQHAGINGTNSIWYMWTAPTNGPFTFDTSGSGYDTLLAVYTGSAFPLTPVASNDNIGPSSAASRVTFDAVSNTVYRIAVDGFPGAVSMGVMKLNWNGPMPPAITNQPASTILDAGATVQFTVGVSGTAPFYYQWRHAGTNLIDDGAHVIGANSSTLTIAKILPADAGGYTVFITNAWGAVTSTPGNLIVRDNPRVVYINHHTAPIGGMAIVPINMQAEGTEGFATFKFSVAFNPALLSTPRITTGSNAPGATFQVNTSMAASGGLGVTMTLAPGTVLPASSTLEIARLLFDVSSSVSNGTETDIGFANQPVGRGVTSTNDTPLVVLFAPGSVTLESRISTASGQFLGNGSFQLSLTGPPNQSYVIEATTNLTLQAWQPVATNQTSPTGQLLFLDPNATNTLQRFFRARLTH